MKCKICNSDIPDGAKVCPVCDAQVKGKNTGAVIAIVIAVIVFVIVAVAAAVSIVRVLSPHQEPPVEKPSTHQAESFSGDFSEPPSKPVDESSPQAIISTKYVVDDADLFTNEEEAELNRRLHELYENHNFEVVIHTTDSYGGKTAQAYADDYYDMHEYGYGENRDGCILVLNMKEREWYISTCGSGITYFTDATIQYIGETITTSLKDNKCYDAADVFIYEVGHVLDKAK